MIIFIEESNFKQRQPSLKDGILKGILWHQGEAGAHSENAIQVYEDKYENAV
ncbi:sialate O-acetylesterase [Reichenbachiella sp. MALMAid0571]|uniref:sialate O-acetylesterase n=1 Tax=Reichenbachiella sp. MALMAid0571 TaxID=3143939 RepID=UPI0032DE2BE5